MIFPFHLACVLISYLHVQHAAQELIDQFKLVTSADL